MRILEIAYWIWVDWLWIFSVPVILFLEAFHMRRLYRGKIRRALIRRYGPVAVINAHGMFLALIFAALAATLIHQDTVADILFALYFTIRLAWDIVDYITGGDDPGRRLRSLASKLKEKLVIKPSPRPVYRPTA